MARDINIRVKARDEATGVFNRVGRSIGSFARRANAALGGFGGAAAFTGLAFAAKAAISAAAEQEEAERKLASVVRSTGMAAGFSAEAMQQYAAELQGVTKFGDEVTISAQALLATFTSIHGPVFKETIALAQDMSTIIGQNLKSSVTLLGKALNDPLTGLTMLTRVGILFTKSQKEQIKGFAETNRLAEAQRVILDEIQVEFGGAAQAAAQGLGEFTRLWNALGDTSEIAGKKMTSAFTGKDGALATLREDLEGFNKFLETTGRLNVAAPERSLLSRQMDVGFGVVSDVAADWDKLLAIPGEFFVGDRALRGQLAQGRTLSPAEQARAVGDAVGAEIMEAAEAVAIEAVVSGMVGAQDTIRAEQKAAAEWDRRHKEAVAQQAKQDKADEAARQKELIAEQKRIASDEKRHQAKVEADARRIFEATRTDQERLMAELSRIRELTEAGAIDRDTAERASTAAIEAAQPAADTAEDGNVDAAIEQQSMALANLVSGQFLTGLTESAQQPRQFEEEIVNQNREMIIQMREQVDAAEETATGIIELVRQTTINVLTVGVF